MSGLKKGRPFEAGEEVVLIGGSWGRYIVGRRKIAKLYKNGNFVLEGDSQQFKADGYCTGVGRYSSPHVVHADDECVKEIQLEYAFRDARAEVENAVAKLRHLTPSVKATRKLQKILKLIQETIDSDNQPEDFETLDT